jgi:transcription antitermination factor NusG
MTWRIFSVYSGRDFHAVAEVRERGWDAYSPAETVWAGPAKHRRPTKRPIVPGYIFCDLTDEQTAAVCQLSEVASLIWPKGTEGHAVSEEIGSFLARVRLEEQSGAYDRTRRKLKTFSLGDRVRIVKGTFSGFLATISGLRGKKEAEVLLPFSISNGAPMVIDTGKLEHEAA